MSSPIVNTPVIKPTTRLAACRSSECRWSNSSSENDVSVVRSVTVAMTFPQTENSERSPVRRVGVTIANNGPNTIRQESWDLRRFQSIPSTDRRPPRVHDMVCKRHGRARLLPSREPAKYSISDEYPVASGSAGASPSRIRPRRPCRAPGRRCAEMTRRGCDDGRIRSFFLFDVAGSLLRHDVESNDRLCGKRVGAATVMARRIHEPICDRRENAGRGPARGSPWSRR